MKKPKLLAPPPARPWTRVEDYVLALARLRTARRRRHPEKPRSEPEEPRLLLSTLPFLVLTAGLGVLALAIIIAAWPGRPDRLPVAEPEIAGKAPPDWFDNARNEMR